MPPKFGKKKPSSSSDNSTEHEPSNAPNKDEKITSLEGRITSMEALISILNSKIDQLIQANSERENDMDITPQTTSGESSPSTKTNYKKHKENIPNNNLAEIQLHKKRRVMTGLDLSTEENKRLFYKLFGDNETPPNPVFDFDEYTKPQIFITKKQAVIVTFNTIREAEIFERKIIAANKDPTDHNNSLKKLIKTKINKGVKTSLLSIRNSFPKHLFKDVEAMNNFARQLKSHKIIKAYNITLGDFAPELRILGHDKKNKDGPMKWFKTNKHSPTLDNFPHLDMTSVNKETTIIEEDYSQKNNKKRGRENDGNDTNYEAPKPSKKTIIQPGGHYVIIDMQNDKTSTPMRNTDEEAIDQNTSRT